MKLKTIEAGRGIAATMVVLYHAGSSVFPAAKYWHRNVFGGLFGFGYAGVEFFFVLSGFIIAFAHYRDIGKPERLTHFLRRRFNRIYPAYWIVLAVVIALAVLGTGAPLPSLPDVVGSVVLAGWRYDRTVLGVAWTLYHEIGFYLVFALAIWRPWAGIALGCLAISVAVLHIAGIALPLPLYWQAPVNLLFPMGLVALRASCTPWRGGWLAVGGGLSFVAIGLEVVYVRLMSETATQLLFGLAAAAGIAGVVAHERRNTVAVPKLLTELGSASYSIYLVHFLVLSALAQVVVRIGWLSLAPVELEFFVIVIATLAAGYGFHRLVERPLLTVLSGVRTVVHG